MGDYIISKLKIHLCVLLLMTSLMLSESLFSQATAGIIVLETLKTETVTIKATGQGVAPNDSNLTNAQKRLMAKRAATVDAYRKLVEKTKLIQVDSKTLLSDYMVENDSLTAKVSGYIRGAKIEGYRWLDDGTAEVDVAINLGPEFYNRIKPAIK
jgi:hypothetical protein